MEVLAGALDRHHLRRLRRLLLRYQLIPIRGLADYEAAAALYRRCRRQGETVRSLSDCLVAVVALRARASVLHMDRDFVVLASYSRLSIAQPPSG
jgi:predicted nucleic acid-binding protein